MQNWRSRINTIIEGTETPAGKLFDIILLWAILLSVLAVTLESVQTFRLEHGLLLRRIEWFFTVLFTIEFCLRIVSVKKPFKYIFSFYGLIDIISILPTYLSFFVSGSQSFAIIRTFRLLRVFRVLKLFRFMGAAENLRHGVRTAMPRIIVFIGAILSVAMVVGTTMYIIEGHESGFTSIPTGLYWAIVTMTTVGYGDIAPQSVLGQTIATMLMIAGYGIIAVPAGIASVTIARAADSKNKSAMKSAGSHCETCQVSHFEHAAKFCKFCGNRLVEN